MTDLSYNHKLNILLFKIHLAKEKLNSMIYNYEMAKYEISNIMTNFSQISLNAISHPELKQQTFDKIDSLRKIIDLYEDSYREHQFLVIEHEDLVQTNETPSQISDMFSKLAEIVAEGVEEPEEFNETCDDSLLIQM